MIIIRPAMAADAEALRAIEQSAGLAFRAIAELAWLADGDNVSIERHRALSPRAHAGLPQTRRTGRSAS